MGNKSSKKSKPRDELLSHTCEGDIVILYVSPSPGIGWITPTTTQYYGYNRNWKEHGGCLSLSHISATSVTLINSSLILT